MAASAHVQPLDTVRLFATPEHIAFQFRLAGPMARGLAWGIDLMIRVGVLAVVGFGLMLTGSHFGVGVWLVIYFFLDWLAGGLCEWQWKGYTPGKRALGIRVIGTDGLPAGCGACLLRNVLRVADGLPMVGKLPTFLLGVLSMGMSGTFQRLGDLAAGTVVVYDNPRGAGRVQLDNEARARALADELPPELAHLVDGSVARAASGYVARRRQFHPRRRAEMAEHLAGPLRRRLDLPPATDPDLLLCALWLKLFAPGDNTQATADAAVLLAKRSGDWKKLEAVMAGARGRDPVELSRLYRAACADLALADAYHLPAPNVAYLHDLVARAHLAFYRRAGLVWRRVAGLLLWRVPGALYGDGCLRIALLAFFGTFAAAALLGYARGDLAERFLGEDTIAMMREMYAKAPRDRGLDDAGGMGGFYIFNNVGISLQCFAWGLFFGVGSLGVLGFNGLYIGLVFGWMAGTDDPVLRAHFFEFVTAHGPFELTGIALSGAAGLRLGLGLIAGSALTRRDALVRTAREALPIMGVAALAVALAAPIEGFISPSALPLAAKRAVAVLSALLLLTYLVGLGAAARRRGVRSVLDVDEEAALAAGALPSDASRPGRTGAASLGGSRP